MTCLLDFALQRVASARRGLKPLAQEALVLYREAGSALEIGETVLRVAALVFSGDPRLRIATALANAGLRRRVFDVDHDRSPSPPAHSYWRDFNRDGPDPARLAGAEGALLGQGGVRPRRARGAGALAQP